MRTAKILSASIAVAVLLVTLPAQLLALPSDCRQRCTYPNTCDDDCCLYDEYGNFIGFSTCRAEGYCGIERVGTDLGLPRAVLATALQIDSLESVDELTAEGSENPSDSDRGQTGE